MVAQRFLEPFVVVRAHLRQPISIMGAGHGMGLKGLLRLDNGIIDTGNIYNCA
jgi:hypothetical protein